MQKKIYYGKQTEAAIKNFPFPTHRVHLELIYSIVQIKKAAAIANSQAKELPKTIARAIVRTCDEILHGKFDDQFVTGALQGGAGTSINMNVNEVIASRAAELSKITIHPNDHVNKSQSTNDVNPSALRITCLQLTKTLLKNLDILIQAFDDKAKEFKSIAKLGRSHLQDAVPTTLGAEFKAYADILKRDRKRIKEAVPYLYDLNLGGTAIGNRINASDAYIRGVYKELVLLTGFPLKKAENLMSLTSSSSDFCQLSSVINILFTDITKIATDICILTSGPNGGIGELKLKELQSGSSIMPGKVNPVIPEVMNQLSYDIEGKNVAIHQAAQRPYLELAIMFPVLADSLIGLLKLSAEGVYVFAVNCIQYIQADRERCKELLEKSTAFSTLLVPRLGYDVVSSIVKESIATKKTLRDIVMEKKLLTVKEFEELTSL